MNTDSLENVNGVNPELVDIVVKCEVGSVQLTLKDIMALNEGSIVEFSPWPSDVKLMVNGSCIGYGIMVEVNGLLGVKVTKVIS